MGRRKNDAFSEAITGIFMIAVLSLLVYFTIVISGVDIALGREYVRVSIAFSGIGGLKDKDNVMYRGTKVGTVDEVVLTSTNLIAVVDIDKDVGLRTGYRAYVQSMSLLGGKHHVLEDGIGEPIDLTKAPMLSGETPNDWMETGSWCGLVADWMDFAGDTVLHYFTDERDDGDFEEWVLSLVRDCMPGCEVGFRYENDGQWVTADIRLPDWDEVGGTHVERCEALRNLMVELYDVGPIEFWDGDSCIGDLVTVEEIVA